MFGSGWFGWRSLRCCAVFALTLSGCVGDTDDDDDGTSGGGTGGDDCEECGSILWFCYCEVSAQPLEYQYKNRRCTSTKPIAWCSSECGQADDDLKAWCVEEGSCGTWDPGSEISYGSGVYHVDGDFVGRLIGDPAPLWVCDDARVEAGASWFEVANADVGELLYELGLRDGDIPYTLNGMPLESFEDAANAYGALYVAGETEYELWVQRGKVFVLLEYELD